MANANGPGRQGNGLPAAAFHVPPRLSAAAGDTAEPAAAYPFGEEASKTLETAEYQNGVKASYEPRHQAHKDTAITNEDALMTYHNVEVDRIGQELLACMRVEIEMVELCFEADLPNPAEFNQERTAAREASKEAENELAKAIASAREVCVRMESSKVKHKGLELLKNIIAELTTKRHDLDHQLDNKGRGLLWIFCAEMSVTMDLYKLKVDDTEMDDPVELIVAREAYKEAETQLVMAIASARASYSRMETSKVDQNGLGLLMDALAKLSAKRWQRDRQIEVKDDLKMARNVVEYDRIKGSMVESLRVEIISAENDLEVAMNAPVELDQELTATREASKEAGKQLAKAIDSSSELWERLEVSSADRVDLDVVGNAYLELLNKRSDLNRGEWALKVMRNAHKEAQNRPANVMASSRKASLQMSSDDEVIVSNLRNQVKELESKTASIPTLQARIEELERQNEALQKTNQYAGEALNAANEEHKAALEAATSWTGECQGQLEKLNKEYGNLLREKALTPAPNGPHGPTTLLHRQYDGLVTQYKSLFNDYKEAQATIRTLSAKLNFQSATQDSGPWIKHLSLEIKSVKHPDPANEEASTYPDPAMKEAFTKFSEVLKQIEDLHRTNRAKPGEDNQDRRRCLATYTPKQAWSIRDSLTDVCVLINNRIYVDLASRQDRLAYNMSTVMGCLCMLAVDAFEDIAYGHEELRLANATMINNGTLTVENWLAARKILEQEREKYEANPAYIPDHLSGICDKEGRLRRFLNNLPSDKELLSHFEVPLVPLSVVELCQTLDIQTGSTICGELVARLKTFPQLEQGKQRKKAVFWRKSDAGSEEVPGT
ncbi:hypothetical protein BU16DRAFT_594783 [Lophium mytilinum]|uniref:Uncharacterized protein n=1 Tax=Lophium mytilinum TaxID=390894 RepID=A0A6A6QHM6_9PEZI|nr:hypothetical protein BU16DRAFT_594783 [Lophium mytilinum]